jgi:hypothetical protein
VLTVAAFDAATTSGTVHGDYDLVYLSDSLYTCVWDGTAWTYYWSGLKVRRPFLSDFTPVNATGATTDGATGGIYLKSNAPGSAVQNYQLWVRSVPGASYTLTLRATMHFGETNFNQVGAVLRESSTGKFTALTMFNSTANGLTRRYAKYDSAASINSEYIGDTGDSWRAPRFSVQVMHFRAVVDASNITPYWSHDGLAWEAFDIARSKTDFMAGGPNQFGILVSGSSRATYARIVECSAV